MSTPARLAAIVVAVALLLLGGRAALGVWHPSAKRYPLQGVDLPERPPAIEWGSVRAAGADFAYLVATAGARGRDPAFEANWQALPDAGLRRGAVHLYSLCESGGAQADAFNAVVPRTFDALPPAVDVDLRGDCDAPAVGNAVIDQLRTFVARVEAHAGKPVVLRLSRAAERRYRLSAAIDRPLWLTGAFLQPGYAARQWRMWRATRWRRIEGMAGDVNWDVVAQ